MAATCPNKSLPEWKLLESTLGENEAWRAWARNNGEYPSPMEAAFQLFLETHGDNGPYLLFKHIGFAEVSREDTTLDLLKMVDPALYQEREFKSWVASQPFGKTLMPENNIKPEKKEAPQPGLQSYESFLYDSRPRMTPDYMNIIMSESVADYNSAYSEEVLTRLGDNLSQRFGVDYNFVTPEMADNLLAKTTTPYTGEAAFFFAGQVYFVKGKVTPQTMVHEFSHPLVKAISKTNHQLFSNLYDQVSATEEGRQLIDKIRQLYPELDNTSDRFKEEVIVSALEKDATDKIMKQVPTTGFSNVIRNILYAIKQFLRELVGKNIKVEKLDTTTTLSQMAEMIANENFKIEADLITEDQFAEFKKEMDKFMRDINKLQTNEKMQKIIDDFYDITNQQITLIKNNPALFKHIKDILKSEEGTGGLVKIKRQLAPFQNVTRGDKGSMEALRKEMDYFRQQATAFVSSVHGIENMAQNISEELNKIISQKGDPNAETVAQVVHYNYLLDYWKKFIEGTKNDIADAGLSGTPLFKEIAGGAESAVDEAKRQSLKVYQKFVGGFTEQQVENMKTAIDEWYNKTKEELTKKKAPQSRLDDLDREYDKVKLTRERIDDILKGQAGDMAWANAMFESYMAANDPVIGGFATFMTNVLTDINTTVQAKSNDMMTVLEPLLKKAGFSSNPTQIGRIGELLSFVDKVGYYDKDGKLQERLVYTFLNQWKDYRYDLARLKGDLDRAEESGDQDQIEKAWDVYHQFLKDYFQQELVDEYYKVEDKYKKSPLGQKAFAERGAILHDITLATSLANTELDEFRDHEEINILWRKYNQLYSLTNEDGSAKTGEELEKANILRNYREESRKFYEWKPREGAFETALNNFEAQLETSGVDRDSQEFADKVKEWQKKNTRTVYDESWYEKRSQIFEAIKEITERLDSRIADQIDISSVWEEILDTVAGFRDQDGQPVASDMNEKRIEKIRKAQQKIVDAQGKLAGLTGLTTEEMDRLNIYFQKRQAGLMLLQHEEEDFDSLLAKKDALGLDEFEKADLFKLYADLADIQMKQPTDYYLERINYWADELGFFTVDANNAKDVLKDDFVQPLFQKSPEFEAWFKKNHIVKMVYNKETKEKEPRWERLYVWSVVRPTDPANIKKTVLNRIDPLTGKPMEIEGVPTLKYFYRTIKPEYKTGYDKNTGRVKRIVGKHIDIHGNPLPKTVAEGAKDDRYLNKDYFKMKRENPALFELLEKMKEFHLESQKGLPRGSRLGYDLPRYRRSNLEYLQSGDFKKKGAVAEAAKNAMPMISSIGSALADSFRRAADDFEQGMNYDEKNQLKFVRADFFDKELVNIPVTGISNMELDQVSLDVLYGMHRYMYSTERQKKLLQAHPIAKAYREVLNAPENQPKDMSKASWSKKARQGVISYIGKQGDNVRLQSFNSLYEREFLGMQLAGFGKDSVVAQKIMKFVMKRASFGFFAMNIPSAAKNMFGAMYQSMIERAGGEYINKGNLSLGALWGGQALVALQKDVTTRGPKTLRTQIIEIFDAAPGRFGDKFGESTSRNVAKSLASMSWLMSPRKFLELESQLQLFAAMMYTQKVTQTNPDGSKKIISYLDAWQLVDGKIQLKPGIDPEYGVGGKKFNLWKNRITEKMHQLQGNYDQFSQPMGDRYIAMRLMTWMRKYIVSMAVYRWGKRRYNWGISDMQEGYYREFARGIWRSLRNLDWQLKYMTKSEKRAARKLAAELMGIYIMTKALFWVFGYDEDDEDRFDKLKDKPWLMNHALALLLHTRQEASTFVPWPGLGMEEYIKNAGTFSAVIKPTFGVWGELAGDVWGTVTGDASTYYQRDIGPYSWQKAGSNKFWHDFYKMYGITGSHVDPIKAIRDFETYNRAK